MRRKDVFVESAGFRTVHVFVRNAAGDLLLQQVGASNPRSAGRWGSSVAGYLHAGETYGDAARRRMQEEIGLTAPLTFACAALMKDGGSDKFIELFTARAESAAIEDHGSIEQLRFWPMDRILSQLEETPDAFTHTFGVVFQTWRESTQTAR